MGALTLHRTDEREAWSDRVFSSVLLNQLPALKSYARRLTDGSFDAEDLVQDTLLRAWAARSSFVSGSNLGGWTRTIMRNCFLTGKRRARFHVDLSPEAISDMLSVTENQSSVVDLCDTRWALDKLPLDHREAVRLIASGMSFAEGAAQLSLAEGTLKSRVFRGRARLRQLVEEREATPLCETRRVAERLPRLSPSKPRKRRDWTGVMIG